MNKRVAEALLSAGTKRGVQKKLLIILTIDMCYHGISSQHTLDYNR